MATGIVWYWNGESGWIKQTGVENLPTVLARDVMLLASNVVSGVVQQNSPVTFTMSTDDYSWLAQNVTVP